ncbi:PsiF family protein [Sulfuriflexus mobilis]|uniref:PsiF family protein n=1 Tax=Sulfuriflexus mobilis TaxID=1811807 RepID=UPI000F82CD7B|nr:PsiF family protein [Sulfuriflexus mobilis]
MKLQVALLTAALVLSGPLAAEEQAEGSNAEQLAACTQLAEENGLQGEDLQSFMSECVTADSRKESDA